MLVYVTLLRHRGTKRSPDEIKLAMPFRGYLYIEDSLGLHQNEPCSMALLTVGEDPSSKSLVPPLKPVRRVKVKGGSILVLGIERVEVPSRSYREWPQAWWCRLPV